MDFFWRVYPHFNYNDEDTKQTTAENDKEVSVKKVTEIK